MSWLVQGVGYRYFAQRIAQTLRLSGYVRNLPDGRVEVYAIGAHEPLAKLRAALERGPHSARVHEISEEAATLDSQYEKHFTITF